MLGWIILFALMAVLAPMLDFGRTQTIASEMGRLLFGLLFFIGLATRLARGRGW
jgi:hypothetical protein